MIVTFTASRTATARTLELLDPQRHSRIDAADGYYDVLRDSAPQVRTFSQQLMRTRTYSSVYQIGRPIGLRLLSALKAPGRDEDRGRVGAWLGLRPDSVVLDIGCGPGNFTGWFGTQVAPEGLAVGVDASHAMLRRAAADNCGPAVAYLRGDAENLPFTDEVADAVCCLAALYLLNEPFRAIEELARVLKPGGRAVILTNVIPGGSRGSVRGKVLDAVSGLRWFGTHEVTGFLGDIGFTGIHQHLGGLTQAIGATKQ